MTFQILSSFSPKQEVDFNPSFYLKFMKISAPDSIGLVRSHHCAVSGGRVVLTGREASFCSFGGAAGSLSPQRPSRGERGERGQLVNSPGFSPGEQNERGEGAPLLTSHALETRVEYVQVLNCSESHQEGCPGKPVIDAGRIQHRWLRGWASKRLILVGLWRGSAQQTRLDEPLGLQSPAVSWLLCPALLPVWSLELYRRVRTLGTQKSAGNGQANQRFSDTSSARKEYVLLVVNFRWFEEIIATRIQDSVFPPGDGHRQHCRPVCVLAFLNFILNWRIVGQGSLVCCSPWGCKESDMT